ncbi:MAG: TlpA family protein disulfide reductase [Chloroflexi bacterium]|nr:TlpA family protein disulfide reductase [Chloroflexota bacterium]
MAGSPAPERALPHAPRPHVARSTLLVVAALVVAGAAYLVWARLTAPPGGITWGPLDSVVAARSSDRLARPAPPFVLPTPDGGTLALEDLRGHVVLLNFWATWCEPCRAEMADLDRLAREWGPQGVRVVGINVGENPEQVRRFAAELGLQFPLVIDSEGTVYPAYGVMGLPTSFLVDADGLIRDVRLGVITPEYLANRVRPLLAAGS